MYINYSAGEVKGSEHYQLLDLNNTCHSAQNARLNNAFASLQSIAWAKIVGFVPAAKSEAQVIKQVAKKKAPKQRQNKHHLNFGKGCFSCQSNVRSTDSSFIFCDHINNGKPIWNKAYCYDWELKHDEKWLIKYEKKYLARIIKDKSKYPSIDPYLRDLFYKPHPKLDLPPKN